MGWLFSVRTPSVNQETEVLCSIKSLNQQEILSIVNLDFFSKLDELDRITHA